MLSWWNRYISPLQACFFLPSSQRRMVGDGWQANSLTVGRKKAPHRRGMWRIYINTHPASNAHTHTHILQSVTSFHLVIEYRSTVVSVFLQAVPSIFVFCSVLNAILVLFDIYRITLILPGMLSCNTWKKWSKGPTCLHTFYRDMFQCLWEFMLHNRGEMRQRQLPFTAMFIIIMIIILSVNVVYYGPTPPRLRHSSKF